MPTKEQRGFAPLLVLLIIGVLGLLVLTHNSGIDQPSVQGVATQNHQQASSPSAALNNDSSGQDLLNQIDELNSGLEHDAGGDRAFLDNLDSSSSGALNKPISLEISSSQGNKLLQIQQNGDTTTIQSNHQKAQTNLSVSIDQQSDQLVIQTPSGEQKMSVLPDQAVAIARSVVFINQINSMQLSLKDTSEGSDDLVFKISGIKSGKLLGFIPIQTPVQAEIGAESGSVIKTDEPLYSKILSPFITR